MQRFRARSAPVAFALAAALAAAAGARGADENLLRNDRGIVTYALPETGPRRLEGSVGIGDAAIATTASSSLATLQLLDSSEIRIGGLSTVRVGTLRTAAERDPSSTTVVLERGAVRFSVVHPAGARSAYRFVTPTSQLSIRGTVGYFVHGPTGDEIYCVSCDDGDVTVTTALRTVTLHSGQTLEVATRAGRIVGSAIVPNRTVNNPAIDQFLGGFSPFGEPASAGRDPTSSHSGT